MNRAQQLIRLCEYKNQIPEGTNWEEVADIFKLTEIDLDEIADTIGLGSFDDLNEYTPAEFSKTEYWEDFIKEVMKLSKVAKTMSVDRVKAYIKASEGVYK